MSADDSKYMVAADPQTFNLYTYVANNPINSIDPTGHSAVEVGPVPIDGPLGGVTWVGRSGCISCEMFGTLTNVGGGVSNSGSASATYLFTVTITLHGVIIRHQSYSFQATNYVSALNSLADAVGPNVIAAASAGIKISASAKAPYIYSKKTAPNGKKYSGVRTNLTITLTDSGGRLNGAKVVESISGTRVPAIQNDTEQEVDSKGRVNDQLTYSEPSDALAGQNLKQHFTDHPIDAPSIQMLWITTTSHQVFGLSWTRRLTNEGPDGNLSTDFTKNGLNWTVTCTPGCPTGH